MEGITISANNVICGSQGSVSIAGRGARIAAFSADLLHEVYDATGFSSGGFRQNKGGLKACNGTASGFLTNGSSSDNPNFTALASCDDGVAITLTCATGCTYTFSGNISRIRIDERVDDNAKVSFDFQSSGQILEQWVTT